MVKALQRNNQAGVALSFDNQTGGGGSNVLKIFFVVERNELDIWQQRTKCLLLHFIARHRQGTVRTAMI